MPEGMWANVHVRCIMSGALLNQVTVTAKVDFSDTQQLFASNDFFGNSLNTNGKVMAVNNLAGWAWFGSNSFWGGGVDNTIPLNDELYEAAVLSNGTFDIDVDTNTHTWTRPEGVRYTRIWLIQGGGGKGGKGYEPESGSNGAGGAGGNGAAYTSASPYSYEGGTGGRGVMIQAHTTQDTMIVKAGAPGATGRNGTSSSKNGGVGGDGGHTTFGDLTTASALPYSNGRSPASIQYGPHSLTIKLNGGIGTGGGTYPAGPNSYYNWDAGPGGVVFYYQW